jgi:hypothetical protein
VTSKWGRRLWGAPFCCGADKTIPDVRPHVSLRRGPGVKFAQGPVGLFLSGMSRLRRVVELVEDPWSGSLRHPQELLLAVPLEKVLALDEVYFRKKPLTSFSGPFSTDSREPL